MLKGKSRVVVFCLLALLLVAVPLVAAACGDEEEEETPVIETPTPTATPMPPSTPTGTPTPTPATFEVSSLVVTPTEIVAGEPITVKADVKNVGEVEGIYTATLMVDGEAVETKELTVGAGATKTASLTYSVEDAGAHTLELNGLSTIFTALKPAELEASSPVVAPELVLPGKEATVEVEVTNVGEVEGALKAKLLVNGVEADTLPVALAAGESGTVSFTVVRDLPGTYDLSVGGVSTDLTVADVESYESEQYFYAISYPSAWILDDSTPDSVTMVKAGLANLGIRVNILPVDATLAEHYAIVVDSTRQSFPDLRELSRAEVKEDGAVVAYDAMFAYTDQGMKVKMRAVISKSGRWGFAKWGEAREAVYEQNEPLLDACLDSFVPPVVAVGRYTNTTEGFSLTLPAAWDGTETGERMPFLETMSPVGEPLVFINVFVDRIYESSPAKDWALDVAAAFSDRQDYEVVSERDVTLGAATRGYEVVFRYTMYDLPFESKVVSVIRGTQAFTIIVETLAPTYDSARSTIDQLVRSFTLVEPRPFGVSRQSSLFLWEGEIVTLDPALTEGEGIIDAVFSGLVKTGEDWEVVPDIAESWEVSEDGTVYTFHLREGVKFHDGKPVTAADFKYSWERACDPETESRKASTYLGDIVGATEMLAGEATDLSGVRVIDDLTLKVTIDGPKPYFLGKLTWPTSFVVDRANVARGMNWTEKPNGTGPFKLKEWEKDELVVLERNDDYYVEPAKLENVVFQMFAGRRMMMYEQGEIDTTGVYIGDFDRVRDPQDPLNQDLLVEPSIGISYLGFNVTKPPFDDPNVRRAFALALDVDKILEVSWKGNAERSGSYIPPRIPGHNEEVEPLPFDPEQAQQLITESKYGSVDNLPPIVFYDLYSLGSAEEAMIGMWQANLGITVEAQIIEELEEWLERIHRREFQVFTGGWYADYIDPQNFLEVLFHSQSEENLFAYSNPEVDAALERAAAEPDEGTRLKMYQDIEKLILAELPVVPLSHSWKSHVLVKPYVEGYSLTPTDANDWTEIAIKPH